MERFSYDRAQMPAWLAPCWLPSRWLSTLATLIVLTFSLLLWTEDADARLAEGFGVAGAGATAALVIGSFDGLGGLGAPFVPDAAEPSYPGGTLGDLFNRGDLIGAFAAGFLGAGIIGLLFGHGIVTELNSAAAVLGLLFQLALIAMLGRLIWTWWRDDKSGSGSDLSPRQLADAYGRPRHEALPDFDEAPRLEMTIDEPADDGLGHPK